MTTANFDQPSQGSVSSNETALSITNTGTGDGLDVLCPLGTPIFAVYGDYSYYTDIDSRLASAYGTAVWGDSASGSGVLGSSSFGIGVQGVSTVAEGVQGVSSVVDGVKGVSYSAQNAGVSGTSTSGVGVHGESQQNDGVSGLSQSFQHSGVWGNNDSGGVGVAGSSNTGPGVSGTSTSGVGVHAESSSRVGDALEIQGAIRVANSSDGTPAPAFRFTVSPNNIYPQSSPSQSIEPIGAIIDHPLINDDPSALLFVTPIATQQQDGLNTIIMPFMPAVMYGISMVGYNPYHFPPVTDKWVLVENGGNTPHSTSVSVGDTFNILVIRTQPS
jgi:hypothetical protein